MKNLIWALFVVFPLIFISCKDENTKIIHEQIAKLSEKERAVIAKGISDKESLGPIPFESLIKVDGEFEVSEEVADSMQARLYNGSGATLKMSKSIFVDFSKIRSMIAAMKSKGGDYAIDSNYSLAIHFGRHNKDTAKKAYDEIDTTDEVYAAFIAANCPGATTTEECANKLFNNRLTAITQLYFKEQEIDTSDLAYSRLELGRLCPPKCPDGISPN